MSERQALEAFNHLLSLGHETEWIERKEAKNTYDFEKLGKYFSALSNEANLHGKDCGWLIFGVAGNGDILGTHYRSDPTSLESLKHEIANHTSNNLSFVAIHTIKHPNGGRILLFEIPAALKGMPTAWKGHYHGRDGESLVALNMKEIEFIRSQAMQNDWTAQVCHEATIHDLSPQAIQRAREEYSRRNPHLIEEIRGWNDSTFLNKAMVTIKGQITRAAIVLLGRPETEVSLSPSVAVISWILKDEKGGERDYAHFGPPWILNVNALYAKIRNLRYRHMPDGTLFPLELNQYDDWVFREALHNAIAHQDYVLRERISVVEFPDRILFQNAGHFIPRSVEEVIKRDAPATQYRNPFLARAMVNFNMIDTIGSGIKRMFLKQRERFFPMPDYRLARDSVSVTVHGRILDPNYVEQLSANLELNLSEVMLLDKVQKAFAIEKEEARLLRMRGLVEGRYPRLHISSTIAALSAQKARYLHTRGLDEQYYANLVIEHIRKFGSITRREADDLLLAKLPDILSEEQKKNKVHRLLAVVLKTKIQNVGSRPMPKYVLCGNNEGD